MLAVAILLVALAGLSAQTPSDAPPPASPRTEQNEACLACHGDASMSMTLPSGETRSLHVDLKVFSASVHGDKLSCVDCHTDMTEIPHPARPFRTRREFTLAYYEQCKRCHFDNYTKTLDSMHQAPLARGDRTVPVCVDCHGAHDITPPSKPRTRISETCSTCHAGVARTYASSVHGRSLGAGNADVPTCTDCHRAHDTAGPQNAAWRTNEAALCGSCHADPVRMKPYGLSTAVLDTYLADFHGMTASLGGSRETDTGRVVARCTDCHGVHDIRRADEPGSRVLKTNLVKTCQQCHTDANTNFPDAWLSHYEPSWDRTPLVKGVSVAYDILIPFMIGGLVLQILLHLWRVVINR